MPEEAAQPAPEEGGESQGADGLYDLSEVPEELREHVEPHLKNISKSVNDRFMEAADYRKRWEPYEELQIDQIDPETLGGLLSFAQMAEDDQAFEEWITNYAEESGLFDRLGYQKATGEDDLEGFDELGEDEQAERLKQIIAEAVNENLAPINEKLSQQEIQQLEERAYADIEARWQELRAEHEFPEELKDTILKLAYVYGDEDPDPIGKAVEDYQAILSQGEKGLFEKKSGQPAPAEGPGSASTTPEKITTFEQAKAAAADRFKAARTQ